MQATYCFMSFSRMFRLIFAITTSKGPLPCNVPASPNSTSMSVTLFNSIFSIELRTHHSSISIAVQGVAPRIRARIARIEVPHPISRRDFPSSSLFNSSLIIRLVVSWCPVPNAICGLITMSYSAFGTS